MSHNIPGLNTIPKVSSVFVTLTSGSNVKVKVTKTDSVFLGQRVSVFLRLPTNVAQNRTQYMASPNVSLVFVTLISGSRSQKALL